jgi:hypothetical protein
LQFLRIAITERQRVTDLVAIEKGVELTSRIDAVAEEISNP